MRFSIGPAPRDDWDPLSDGWTRTREPSSGAVRVLILAPNVGALWIVWVVATRWLPPPTDGAFEIRLVSRSVVFVAAHEPMHALFHPDHGTSRATTIGFWPSRLVFFAHYDGISSKLRSLCVLIAPFIVLTVLPILGLTLFDVSSSTLGFLAIANAAGSAMDLLGFLILAVGVPCGAEVRNHGWDTYGRLPPRHDERAAECEPRSARHV